jgi:hypothetical protein
MNQANWGSVVVASSPKKTTASFKVDSQGNMVQFEEHGDNSAEEKLKRLQRARAKKLGIA